MNDSFVVKHVYKYRYLTVYIPTGLWANKSFKREDTLSVYTDADGLMSPVSLAGMTTAFHVEVSRTWKTTSRLRNPTDDPPGPGFKALAQAGAYLPQQSYAVGLRSKASDFWAPVLWFEDFLFELPMRINSTSAYFGTQLAVAEEEALRNLYGSLQKRQDIAMGVLLAELKESIGLLGKSMLTIAEIIQALRKGRVSDALSALGRHYGGGVKTRKRVLNRDRTNRLRAKSGLDPLSSSEYASSMWLELQFGWKPILADIYALIEVINGSLNSEGDGVLSFKGYGSFVEEYTNEASVNYSRYLESGGLNSETVPAVFSGRAEYRTTCTATYKCRNDALSVLTQLGLLNPLSVAWEIVPFSFVIDWLLPVGDFLSSLTADAGLELLDYSTSVGVKIDGTFEASYSEIVYTTSGTSYMVERPFTVKVKEETFNRFVYPVEEIPPSPLPSFTFEELLDPWKIATSLALLR